LGFSSEHVLLREIREQPGAIRNTIGAESHEIDQIAHLLQRRRIHFIGMGSSYFASIYANYLLAEQIRSAPVNHLASEFIHYPSTIPTHEISLALSQSGESIETVKAVQILKKKSNFVIVVTNEPRSTLARLSDRVLLTHAEKERASSTKTFASTLAILYCLIVSVAAQSGQIGERKRDILLEKLLQMTRTMDECMESWSQEAKHHANKLLNCEAAMILGRGPNLPAALQGALLLKEVTKLPAEGMSSGEFAHGPIEAISKKFSVVVLGGGRTSNLQYRLALRSKSLHAKVLMLTPHAVRNMDSINYGETDEDLAIFPSAVLLELLAYHAAVRKGLNPDHFNVIHKVTRRE
jgi:glucosamine--fructose-6-phosphate aminotransferase (isomerizing)